MPRNGDFGANFAKKSPTHDSGDRDCPESPHFVPQNGDFGANFAEKSLNTLDAHDSCQEDPRFYRLLPIWRTRSFELVFKKI